MTILESAERAAGSSADTVERPISLSVHGLTKTFYGVPAIDDIEFELSGGEIHGVLGENGAGKSTLCSVLAGLYRPDRGTVEIDGQTVQLRSPQDASARGIGMVYQHFRLVESFTVAENIVLGLGGEAGRGGRREVEQRVTALAEEYGLEVDPGARIWQLSVGEQQRVEILKQLYRGARVLILDEPTAVLAPHEAEALFRAVRAMVDKGHAVVLVSHKMAEILAYTDRVTVLRRGRNAGTGRTAEMTPTSLSHMLFGDTYVADDLAMPRTTVTPGEAVLQVDALSVRSERGHQAVQDVTLTVRRGEIVGVAGVAGNGQRELQEAIAGLRRISSGNVTIGGLNCTGKGARVATKAGLAYVPEDRLGTGLAPGLPLEHNMVLKNHTRAPFSRLGVLSHGAMARATEELVAGFDVRGARPGMRVSLMSGGNLQKAIMARELTEDHHLLLAAAPTRGLDIAAARAVREHIVREREERRGVLLFSEDLSEVVELSDVVVVLFQGRVVGTFGRDEIDVERIGLLMTGVEEAA